MLTSSLPTQPSPLAHPVRRKESTQDTDKTFTKLRRMDSRDTAVAPPTRRPSWTGALGAKLGRILSPYEEHVVEKDAFKSLPDDVSSIVSVGRGYRGVVAVGKKEGE